MSHKPKRTCAYSGCAQLATVEQYCANIKRLSISTTSDTNVTLHQGMSQNIKLGLQYRYQQGKVQVNHNHFLGYTKDADGNLIIDPEQAETVKRTEIIDIIAIAAGHPDNEKDTLLLFANSDTPYVKFFA